MAQVEQDKSEAMRTELLKWRAELAGPCPGDDDDGTHEKNRHLIVRNRHLIVRINQILGEV